MAIRFLEKLEITMQATIRLILFFILTLIAWPAISQDKLCAVILMHGKYDRPQSLSSFANKLGPECTAQPIEMPWSPRRGYDVSYLAAISEIKTHVDSFRQQGFKNVILAGHSFGTNAALAYMATEADVDGIIAMAAGHSPGWMYDQGQSKEIVDKASRLISEGRGDDKLTMEDNGQGKRFDVNMRANVLFSYFDPKGLGHMPNTASNFKKSVPVLWVVGTRDPLFLEGSGFAFDKIKQNNFSRYIAVDADHFTTPNTAVNQVKYWLKSTFQSAK